MTYFRYFAVVVIVAATGGALWAQAPQSLHIVITRGAPKGSAAAEVLIKGGRESQNIIIVAKRASADDLAAAVDIARHLRGRVGDTLTKDIRAVARPGRAPSKHTPEAIEYRAGLSRALDHLDKRKPEALKGFGTVKHIDFVTYAWNQRSGR